MKFDPATYVDVATRIQRFYERWPEGRITTDMMRLQDGVVVFRAQVYRDREAPADKPDAVGWAHEVADSGPVNRTSLIENAETSAIGRALANLGFPVKEGEARPSREEMQGAGRRERALAPSAARAEAPPPADDVRAGDVLDQPLAFGKHRGQTWRQLLETAPDYVDWAIANLQKLGDAERNLLQQAVVERQKGRLQEALTNPFDDDLPFE